MEDNETDVFVIRNILERAGLDLDLKVVPDGEHALDYLRRVAADRTLPCPALILLDLNIPKVPGMEVLREIRKLDRCGNTRVIVVTSSTSDADAEGVRELGASAHFVKPTDLGRYSHLADIVKQVLQ